MLSQFKFESFEELKAAHEVREMLEDRGAVSVEVVGIFFQLKALKNGKVEIYKFGESDWIYAGKFTQHGHMI